MATTAEVLQRELREDIANKRGPRSEFDDSTAGVTSVPHTYAMKKEGYVNPQSTVGRTMGAGHGKAGPLALHEWLYLIDVSWHIV